jgi:hypothetical protein
MIKGAGDSRYTSFRYPRFYFNISCGTSISYLRPNFLKPITCVEPSQCLSGNVMQMISLASNNSGASLTSKWRLLYVSRFTRFHYTRRFTGTQPPCTKRVTCNWEQGADKDIVPNREEVGLRGEWRKANIDELHNLYSSLNIVRANKYKMRSRSGDQRLKRNATLVYAQIRS